ncbi:unnamed protein product, partial [Rotaria magnacalcarata]
MTTDTSTIIGTGTADGIFTYDDSITTVTTTIDTQKPLKSTSSFPHRQAIDECGGIC